MGCHGEESHVWVCAWEFKLCQGWWLCADVRDAEWWKEGIKRLVACPCARNGCDITMSACNALRLGFTACLQCLLAHRIVRVLQCLTCLYIYSVGWCSLSCAPAYMYYYDNPKGNIPTWLINWACKVSAQQEWGELAEWRGCYEEYVCLSMCTCGVVCACVCILWMLSTVAFCIAFLMDMVLCVFSLCLCTNPSLCDYQLHSTSLAFTCTPCPPPHQHTHPPPPHTTHSRRVYQVSWSQCTRLSLTTLSIWRKGEEHCSTSNPCLYERNVIGTHAVWTLVHNLYLVH